MESLYNQSKEELIAKIANLEKELEEANKKLNSIESNEQKGYISNDFNMQNIYFQKLLESLPEAIVIVNNEDKIISINSGFTKLFHYSLKEISGEKINNVIVPKDLSKEAILYSKKALNKEVIKTETIRKKKDGTLVDVSILGTSIVIGKKLEAVIGIYRDISNKKQKERQIKLQNEELEAANEELSSINEELSNSRNMLLSANEDLRLFKFTANYSSDSIYWLNKRGAVIFANKASRDLLGYTEKEMLDLSVFDIDSRLNEQKWKKFWQRMQKEKSVRMETEQNQKDGTTIIAEVFGNYVEFEGNQLMVSYVHDITERKKAELYIIESEMRFRSLAENVHDGVAIIENGEIIYSNDNLLEIFGISDDEIKHYSLQDFLMADKQKCIRETFFGKEKRNKSHSATIESWVETKNNKQKFIQAKYSSKNIENKTFRFVIISDLTERKNYEDLLRKERNLLNNVIENNPYSIALIDKNGYILKANKSLENLFGGIPSKEYCLFEDPILKKNGYIEEIKDIANRDVIIIPDLVYNPREISDTAVNKKLYLRTVTFPLHDNNGDLDQIVIMHQDVTSIKLAESALKESEELFRSLVSTTASGLLIYQGIRLKYMNKAAEIITGYSMQDISDMDFLDIIHPDYWDTVEKQSLRVLGNENTLAGFELKIITKSGEEKWIDIRGNNIMYKGKRGGIFTFFDISSKKLAEEALKRSEQKYRLIFDQSPLGVVHLDKESNIMDCNDKFCEIISASKEMLLGFNLLNNLTNKEVNAAIGDALNGKSAFFEGPYKTFVSNREIFMSLYAKPIIDIDGTLIGGVGLVEDISERYLAQQLVKQTLAEKDVILSTLPDILFILSLDGTFLDCHSNNENELILPKEEIIGKSLHQVLPAWNADILLSKIELTKKTNKLQSFEYSVTIHNENRFQEARMAMISEHEILAIIRDITDRKSAEIKVIETGKMIEQERNIFISGPVMVFKWNDLESWQVEYASPNIVKHLGYKVMEFSTGIISFVDLIFEADFEKVIQEIRLKIKDSLSRFEIEPFRIISKNGDIFWVSSYINSITENNVKKYLGYIVDVTDRKLAEEEVIVKNKELENFLYVTSHDIRSPLVNIQGFSKEIEKAMQDIDEIINNNTDVQLIREKTEFYFEKDISESLNFIFSSTEKMENLLTGLLKLSRMGRFTLTIEEINMNELCKEVASNFEYKIQELGIQLKINQLPPCQGDRNMINQVISNLIDNAIKYLKPNVKGSIIIDGYQEGDFSIYTVEDNGIGIKPQDQMKIFEIFKRFNKNIDGEGIGLTMIKKIIERHKGEIWLESEYNVGSKFYISIYNKNSSIISN